MDVKPRQQGILSGKRISQDSLNQRVDAAGHPPDSPRPFDPASLLTVVSRTISQEAGPTDWQIPQAVSGNDPGGLRIPMGGCRFIPGIRSFPVFPIGVRQKENAPRLGRDFPNGRKSGKIEDTFLHYLSRARAK
jgi:hypothetical protein